MMNVTPARINLLAKIYGKTMYPVILQVMARRMNTPRKLHAKLQKARKVERQNKKEARRRGR